MDASRGTRIQTRTTRLRSASSDPWNFTNLPESSTVWFSAYDDEHGRELWRVDDSLVPTMVRDIWPGPGTSNIQILHLWPDGRVLLSASDPDHACELWVSDGSSEGTVLVRDIRSVPPEWWGGPCPRGPASLYGVVYFTVDDGIHGDELWRTDGTAEGTVLVADLEPGPEGSSPYDLLAVDGRIVFSATRLFQDLRPGVGSGDPSGFSAVGDRIFFKAFDEEAGYEPWSFRRCRLPGADSVPPEGAITTPADRACFGPSAVPVVVQDSFVDRCDEEIVRTYTPTGGPNYTAHGDLVVDVVAADSAGNTASATRAFTIDLVPPVVTLMPWPRIPRPFPSSAPLSLAWRATDADGAIGGVTRERVFIDDCLLWDGAMYGNGNGLLSDESLVLGRDELCKLVRTGGLDLLQNPTVRVEASDCGGNIGSASARIAGAFRIPTRVCGR
jgi:ELWxxDGT repeat protein